MTYVPTKDIKIKERQDKFLKAQLEKEREQALLEEIEKTEKERVKKKGLKVLKQSGILDAYQGLLVSLCKYGLPTEDLYEFSALTILKHEKKLKAQKKKELDERLKERNAQKQLNPVRSRAVSNNAGPDAETRQQAILAAAGVSPNVGKNRAGSKRRVIGASSVERPNVAALSNQNVGGARGSVAATQKRSGKNPKIDEGDEEQEDPNPFTVDNDSAGGLDEGERKPKKSKKSKRASNLGDDQEEAEETRGAAEATADGAEGEAPKKKKKKRAKESAIDVAAAAEEEANAAEEEPVADKKPKKKKRARDEDLAASQEGLAESATAGEEAEAPKKKKKKRTKEVDEDGNLARAESVEALEEDEAPKKKKKKKKVAAADEGDDGAEEE